MIIESKNVLLRNAVVTFEWIQYKLMSEAERVRWREAGRPSLLYWGPK